MSRNDERYLYNTDDLETFNHKRSILHRVKFSILLTLGIPAVLLSLLICYFFFKNRTVFQTPQNHALFILLVVNFIQLSIVLPFSIHFYAVGSVTPATPIHCTAWTFLAFTLSAISQFLIATISVQRHMLVFNSRILRIRWKLIVFHHFPLIFCLIYPTIFYVFAILVYPCDGNQWDYRNSVCGSACCYLLYNKVLGTFDGIFNNGMPILVNAVANALLVIRVIKQKRQRGQRLNWKQQRRMTVQLFCISSLYLVCWTPTLIVILVQILGHPTFMAEILTTYFLELISLISLLLPWLCVCLVPELLRWIKVKCRLGAPRNVVGTTKR